jgi:hypothetical protein
LAISLVDFLSARRHPSMDQPHIPPFNAGWRGLYESAMLEVDDHLLPERISVARRAILDRAEALLTKPSGEEHRALNDALRTLRILEEVAAREEKHAIASKAVCSACCEGVHVAF